MSEPMNWPLSGIFIASPIDRFPISTPPPIFLVRSRPGAMRLVRTGLRPRSALAKTEGFPDGSRHDPPPAVQARFPPGTRGFFGGSHRRRQACEEDGSWHRNILLWLLNPGIHCTHVPATFKVYGKSVLPEFNYDKSLHYRGKTSGG